MTKKENIENPSQQQVEAWKKEHGDVYSIEVALEPESMEPGVAFLDLDELPKITGWLKKPDRKVMNFALVGLNRNPISAGKAVLKDCWLGGDLRILNEDKYASAAALQAVDLIDIYQSRLKKL